MSIAPQPQAPQQQPAAPQEAALKKSSKLLLILTIFFVLVAIGTSILAGPRVYELVNIYSVQNSLTTRAKEVKDSLKASETRLKDLKKSPKYQKAVDGARLWCSTVSTLAFEDADSWDANLNPIELSVINETCPENVARWKATEDLRTQIMANLKVHSCNVSFGSLIINASMMVGQPEGIEELDLIDDTIVVLMKGEAVEGSVVASEEFPVFVEFWEEKDFSIYVPLRSKNASRCTVEPVSWTP